jgi:hypothetical protein
MSVVAAIADRGMTGINDPGYRNQLSRFFAGARGFGAAITTREFFNASRGIDELLFAREKRMASGADADFNVTPGRAGMINRAAGANDIGLYVFRMNARFHVRKSARNLLGRGSFRKQ